MEIKALTSNERYVAYLEIQKQSAIRQLKTIQRHLIITRLAILTENEGENNDK